MIFLYNKGLKPQCFNPLLLSLRICCSFFSFHNVIPAYKIKFAGMEFIKNLFGFLKIQF